MLRIQFHMTYFWSISFYRNFPQTFWSIQTNMLRQISFCFHHGYTRVQNVCPGYGLYGVGPSRSRCDTPMMMPHPCPSSSRLLKTFFESNNFFIMKKWPVSEKFRSKLKLWNFTNFTLWNFKFQLWQVWGSFQQGSG